MSWLRLLLYLIALSLFFSYIVIPWTAHLASSFRLRATKLSPLSARGIEWRAKSHANASLPTLRIERIYWSWGGCTERGRVALNIEGVTYRHRPKDLDKPAKRKKLKIPAFVQPLVNHLQHILLHHWSSIAGLISLRVADVRVVFEDMGGLEATVSQVHFGFGRDSSGYLEVHSPVDDTRQEFPDRTHTTSPASYADANGASAHSPPPPLGRRQSTFQRASKTASKVWSHAIGSAIDRVAFTVAVFDVAVQLPQPDQAGAPSLPHLTPKTSSSSLKAAAAKKPPTFPTLRPLNTLLNLGQYQSILQNGAGYEKLFAVEGRSTLFLSVGIGPSRPLLAQDNLRVVANVATLHASLDGVDKIRAAVKSRPKKQPQDSRLLWARTSAPRLVLQAIQNMSFSFHRTILSHTLYAPSTPPTTLSTAPPDAALGHILSLEIYKLSVNLSATHSGSDERLTKIFGANTNPSSLVHGVTANLQWQTVELQCIAPGDAVFDKSQLFAVRQANFDVLSTWHPSGWESPDMLFRDDPNLDLVIARGYVSSVDGAGDIQLFQNLISAMRSQHPSTPREKKPRLEIIPVPPQVRFSVDVGPMALVVANGASHDSATISLASDGLGIGMQSSFHDRVFVKCPSTGDHVPARSETESVGATHNSEVPHDVKAVESEPPGPDPSFVMRGEAFCSVEPISLRLSLGQRNEKTYRIASSGRIQCKAISEISGANSLAADGSEQRILMRKTFLTDIEIAVDEGVKVEIWNPDVIQALCVLAGMKEPSVPKGPSDPLDMMPHGVTLRVAVGVLSVFIGHEDLNPNCNMSLVHGIWLQSTLVFDYARYRSSKLRSSCRYLLDMTQREKLRLFSDITDSAFTYAGKIEKHGGDAALFSLIVRDTAVKTVFNGQDFITEGGTDNFIRPDSLDPPAHPEIDPEYLAWGWDGPKRRERPGISSDHVPKSDLSPGSFLRIPYIHVTGRLERPSANAHSEINIQARIEHVRVTAYLSDVYCLLLASHTIHRISHAFRRPRANPNLKIPRRSINLSVLVPSVWVHIHFPLKEQVFLSVEHITAERSNNKVPTFAANHILLYVASAAAPGFWDELGLIKKLKVAVDHPRTISVSASAMRIRIPYAYLLSHLILNVSVAVKTVKLLMNNLKSGYFSLVKKPISEGPKKVPHISIHVDLLHLEARDHPVENKLNLANRVGLLEQKNRLSLDEVYQQKMMVLSDTTFKPHNHLTPNQSVSAEEARWRLDWHISRNWIKRIKRAKDEQRRREQAMHAKMLVNRTAYLPIPVLPLEQTTPLFRVALLGVDVNLSPPNKSRSELIDYMGEVSPKPFQEDVQFSLMFPFNLEWTMAEAKVTLRDYPLPLLRIHSAKSGPAWRVTTLFVVAEELADDDSSLFIPVEVLPERCGHQLAKPLRVQIAKTIMPVKTYARPEVKITTPEATRITWCNSYQPGLSDVSRVFDKISHPPYDPSIKPGFWDKLRLILHWRVSIDFAGSLRFYVKGSSDPYAVTGYGAGFALVWRRNVRIEVCQPNAQHEVVQAMADELLVSIPDLAVLHDEAAVGGDVELADHEEDRKMIERRSTKPCARFMNGIRFGLGFQFERTCRPWNCTKRCGDTDNLLHRQCRFFDFKPHQAVTLRSPQAVELESAAAGHPVDSYEGFRSDYVHFSVSLVAPRDPSGGTPQGMAAETHNSLHLSPKAFAHFFAWWKLFKSKIPGPIRQGKVFPDSPPPHKKFGRSMATIKYRCDLAPVYLSHVYSQYSKELWNQGLAQSLGFKFRAGRFRLDGHQRQQEKREWNEMLERDKIVVHKPFYAVDLLLDDILLKGIVADFDETHTNPDAQPPSGELECKASELPVPLRQWFNYFDFIDADYKPFDRDPRTQITHMGDCPHVFLSRRVKALKTKPSGDDDLPEDMEASKFGHEKTHVCYLGAALGVGPMQALIAQERVAELEEMRNEVPLLTDDPNERRHDEETIKHRINTLKHHIDDLAQGERRHMDDNTLQQDSDNRQDEDGELLFQNTLHMHCPRLFYNNNSRNIIMRYLFARSSRRREEYTTSYSSLRAIRDGVNRRKQREHNGLNMDDFETEHSDVRQLLKELESQACDKNTTRFRLPPGFFNDQDDFKRPQLGLAPECEVHPHWRMLVLKPQIALRSTADTDAIVLVALEEISFKSFAIQDANASDHVAGDVLSRNYVALKGLQGFYPTEETLERTRNASPAFRQLDFIPLEIFLDVRSEATDYERIILRTDMALSFDKFNHLRATRGLEWPEATNEFGEPINHLRKHQDLTNITIPRITVSATSKHYTALYYIATNLLMYEDPQQTARKNKVDGFMYKFDRRDRDPQQLLYSLFIMQNHIRNLSQLQRGYEANVARLTEQGKRELFRIRTDLLSEYESLFTVFDVINHNRHNDEARDAQRTQERTNVRAGNIAWHMLRDEGDPLVKLNIKHALFGMEKNQDGTADYALALDDLQALNSNADALFTEVLSRASPANKKIMKQGQVHSDCFISVCLSWLPNVGGIGVFKELAVYLIPVRFRLEQTVGSMTLDYLFNDKTKRRKTDELPKDKHDGAKEKLDKFKEKHKHDKADSLAPATLSRSPSRTTLASVNTQRQSSMSENAQALNSVPDIDAEEMRRRAKKNMTFVYFIFGPTFFVLDYKRDDKKKQHGLVWPECADFRLEAPKIEYHNKVWEAKDIIEHIRKDIRTSVLSQKSDIVGQLFKKTSLFQSKKNLRQIAGINTEVQAKEKKSSPRSPLRFTVQPATPLDLEDGGSPTLHSTLGSSPLAVHRSVSALSNEQRRRSSASTSNIVLSDDLPLNDEPEGMEDMPPALRESRRKRARGLITRLRRSGRFDREPLTADNSRVATPEPESEPVLHGYDEGLSSNSPEPDSLSDEGEGYDTTVTQESARRMEARE